ncbi:hypothetical protein J1N35_013062 [Gossypium stocksii]|uniref:DC1 domain-containing protein n=1 Tax=Gossypium stocksii TaxID=47602 RepID=A0A9D4A8H1_9ROSI|nr:hypothetical protein J1N35_013062 [Gossypium stocksii]
MEASNNYGHQHPLLLILNQDQLIHNQSGVTDCSRCGEKVSAPCFCCADHCGFYLHNVCTEAPLELNHPFHFNHPLLLMQNAPYSSGREIKKAKGLRSTTNIQNRKQIGTKELDHVALQHPLISTKNGDEELGDVNCINCHYEVDPEHGSYCCSQCNITFHVHCVTEDKRSYAIVSLENEDEMTYESSIIVIESNDAGEVTKVKHFKHMHNLMLGPFDGGYENSCDGCMLPISDPFYYCSECVFFLHKACAELPKMKNVWHELCREPLALISDKLITNVMSIFFHSLLMMITVIQKVIIAISVKKVEIQIVGFIIVQYAILLFILIVFLENIHSLNSGASLKE